jgi:hypothetical protein
MNNENEQFAFIFVSVLWEKEKIFSTHDCYYATDTKSNEEACILSTPEDFYWASMAIFMDVFCPNKVG